MLPTSSTSLYFLLILALTLHCLQQTKACLSSKPQVYVVTLRSYDSLSAQEQLIHSALSLYPKTTWRFVNRDNVAAQRLPTDFLLVEAACIEIADALRNAKVVKSLSVEAEHGRAIRALLRQQKRDFDDSMDTSTMHNEGVKSPHQSGHTLLDEKQSGSEQRTKPIPSMFAFDSGDLWKRGYLGAGVKVAVFDTGIMEDEAHFPNLVEKTDWTGENTTVDKIGHGTFVAGLIGGSHPACPGIAPHADLYIFRVFTGAQISYTSWFLDAFNYALHIGIDVLNLSIGGPDFADNPFTEKVNELTASGVIVISAIGNDGPLWGSLNNPGDMMEVVGVGAVEPNGSIASFSSRGMTTHELDGPQLRYGRVKPDLVTYGRSVIGPSHKSLSNCRRLSGTSVASPVVAGSVILLASAIPEKYRKRIVNPAGIKRALLESARRIPSASIYEQGAGLLDLNEAYAVLKKVESEYLILSDDRTHRGRQHFKPSQDSVRNTNGHELDANYVDHAVLGSPISQKAIPEQGTHSTSGLGAISFPASYDLTVDECSYMWPHCAQPLFKGAMTLSLNMTILNIAGVQGAVEQVEWVDGKYGHLLQVNVTHPTRFWPWAAGVGIHITVIGDAKFAVVADGLLRFRVLSIHENTYSDLEVPIRVSVIVPPAREKRVLWDVYHSIRYPPGYVPRDNLAESKDMLDWLGDHPHTNYHALFRKFVDNGFFIDILDTSIVCLDERDLQMYGAVIILDSEDFFTHQERDRLEKLVKVGGVALIVAAEWYNADIMKDIRFEDDSTRSWWSPIIAGGNVPAINNLLRPFDIAFGDLVLSGDVHVGRRKFQYESGVAIVKFPAGSEVLFVHSLKALRTTATKAQTSVLSHALRDIAILGIANAGKGAVLAYGDTNCLDTAYSGERCFDFFVQAVTHTVNKCTGNGTSDKFISSSHVLNRAMIPTGSLVGRAPYALPSDVMSLLKPHSKVLANVDDSAAGVMSFKSDEALCRGAETNERSLVGSRRADTNGISFPSRRAAKPLGSVWRYYRSVDLSWYLTPSGEDGKSVQGGMMRSVLFGYIGQVGLGVPRWMVSLIFGITLIAWSARIRVTGELEKKRCGKQRWSKAMITSKSSSTRRVCYSYLLNFGRLSSSTGSRD